MTRVVWVVRARLPIITMAAVLLVLSAPLAAAAQSITGHRIGWLMADSRPSASTVTFQVTEEAFRRGLRTLGYVEGKNLVIEYRYAEGKAERLPDLAAELVHLQVDVLVAGGAPAIRAAQLATRTIPIIMTGTADPLAQGFIASLARPGGNITGMSDQNAELHAKRLELLKATAPQTARVAVLLNPNSPYHASRLHSLTVAAQTLGVHLQAIEVRRAEGLDTVFAALAQASAGALLVMDDALVITPSRGRRIADLAATSRLLAMYSRREFVIAGGLMSTRPISASCTGAPPRMWTRSSRARSLQSSPSSSPPSSSWSSISRVQRHDAHLAIFGHW